MIKRHRFAALFERLDDSHMYKDVVQLPLALHENYGFDVELISGSSNVKIGLRALGGVRIRDLAVGLVGIRKWLAVLLFFLREAGQIDVLNLYHFDKRTIAYGWLYKLLNKNGFCYIKLDLNADIAYRNGGLFKRDKLLAKLFYSMFGAFAVRLFDLMSVESEVLRQYLLDCKQVSADKLIVLGNGVGGYEQAKVVRQRVRKENVICQSGRIGASGKNNELLLKVLPEILSTNWNVLLVGPVEPAFQVLFDKFCEHSPAAKERVKLTGNIASRDEYFSHLAAARIFCHTSVSEGAPLVFAEARCCNCYIVATDVSGLEQIKSGSFPGQVVQQGSESALRDALMRSISEWDDAMDVRLQEMAWGNDCQYDWRHIVRPLAERIAGGTLPERAG